MVAGLLQIDTLTITPAGVKELVQHGVHTRALETNVGAVAIGQRPHARDEVLAAARARG